MDKKSTPAVVASILAVFCLAGALVAGFANEDVEWMHEHYVEVWINNTAPLREILEDYTIYDQRGDIVVLKQRTD